MWQGLFVPQARGRSNKLKVEKKEINHLGQEFY